VSGAQEMKVQNAANLGHGRGEDDDLVDLTHRLEEGVDSRALDNIDRV